MYSIPFYSQFLNHLSSLSQPRTRYVRSSVSSSQDSAIICFESFLHTLDNLRRSECFESMQKYVGRDPIRTTIQSNKTPSRESRVSKVITNIHNETQGKSSLFEPTWGSTYVSGPSFEVNKRSYCNNEVIFSRRLTSVQYMQKHGFKTKRKKLEQEQSGILPYLKRVLGFGPSPHSFVALNTKPSNMADVHEFKLDHISDSKTMTADQKNMLKLAFAEGYLSGSQKTGSRSSKIIRLVQQFLVIGVLGLCITLFIGSNGSVFKIPLGTQVEVDPEEIHVQFSDVKGADEAKQELKDVVEFLKNPAKFSALGGKLPKGVLLVGPPGTGKTLLARAVAGEAGVPFFHAAGPEFDEILVGQGARRVRDLFKSAKERSPCLIFIDEIDSVGAKRTNSVLHPYANQTINQLLTEMDGFHHNQGVIVIGATNRKDDLDHALLRPGRFDVIVEVPIPDLTGRMEILELYISKILSKDLNVDVLARGTTGFTGADLENMVNQAALKAASDGAETVTQQYLEWSRDKILMGTERKSRLPDEEANTITAYHEAGHAVVAHFTQDSDTLHKVTIIPRGSSLGHTAYIPGKDVYHVTKSKLLAKMDTLMGGRAAEELVFGTEKVTSGCSSDLIGATSIATHMVKEWGMSDKVGMRTFKQTSQSDLVGNGATDEIDSEIKQIVQESYDRAKNILKTNAKAHKLLAEALLKYETLDADDVKVILNGKKMPPNKTLK